VEHTAAAARRAPVEIPTALRGTGSTQNVRATHHATLLAQLWGVDLTQIRGTGNAGQVTKTDLLAAIVTAGGTIDPVAAWLPGDAVPPLDAERPATPAARRLAAGLRVPLRSVEPHPGERRIRKADVLAATEGTGTERFVERPFSATHRVMARRVGESKRNAPHFRLVIDVRIDELLALGETASGKSGIKVSLNDLLVAASAHVLTTVDGVNVHVLDDRIRQFKDADIAIAVSTAQGLIAPVVRAANSKGITEIATEARALVIKAREGRLSSEEVEGGTFTISNLGMFGVREFDAIINPPQGAILAVGAARREKLLTETGAEIVATVVTVTMSCDHRAIDGALGARFLTALKALIEGPASLEDPRAGRTLAPESRSGGMA
jgi:pyruvate dehydrogenase E2 component (dihydrolipoamide acetyltransferase)